MQRLYKAFDRPSDSLPNVRHGRPIDSAREERIVRPIGSMPRTTRDWR